MTTTVSDLIGKLENMGYHLYLECERVKFKYTLLGEPPLEAKPLLDTLRGFKPEVVTYLKTTGNKLTTISYDTLKTLYLDAFNRVGWKIGLMAKPEVKAIEDRLNRVWLDCMEGKATLDDFKATLKEWELVVSKAIKQIAD